MGGDSRRARRMFRRDEGTHVTRRRVGNERNVVISNEPPSDRDYQSIAALTVDSPSKAKLIYICKIMNRNISNASMYTETHSRRQKVFFDFLPLED